MAVKTPLYKAVLFIVLIVMPLSARADEGGAWTYKVEALSGFPLQVGLGAQLDGPRGFRLHSSLGVLPSSYLDSIHAIAEAAEWYGPTTAQLTSAALEDSVVWRTQVAWRPFTGSGFYFGGGYTLTALGGGLTGAELLTAVTGKTIPSAADMQQSLNVNAATHMLDVEHGWEWFLMEKLVLRAGLAGSFTVASQTEISPSREIPRRFEAAVDELLRAGEDYLDDTLQSYIHTAVLIVSVGWQF